MTNNSLTVSSISNTSFIPSTMDSLTFHKSRAQLIDLRRKVTEAKNERLKAMDKYLYNHPGHLYSERDLAEAFDLEFRDIVQARTNHIKWFNSPCLITRHEMNENIQLIHSMGRYMVAEATPDGEWGATAIKIFCRKVPVAWAPLDEQGNPIRNRVSFRKETQYYWMYTL